MGKQTYAELSLQAGKSVRTLQQHFDAIEINVKPRCLFDTLINSLFDGTFFSRSDGVLVYRANSKNLYWQFIQSEKLAHISAGLDRLEKLGYSFSSFTIDGRKGVIQLLVARYPNIPVQLCQFHQSQIIRRYTTQNPKTECAKELKSIMACLTETTEDFFKSLIETWHELWAIFLKSEMKMNSLSIPDYAVHIVH